MSVQIRDFPEHISGTTYLGCQFYIERNAVPLPLAGSVIEMNFSNGQHIFTNGSGITVTNPNGYFKIDEQIIDWEPGIYKYELWITLASGNIGKYLMGSWRISNG